MHHPKQNMHTPNPEGMSLPFFTCISLLPSECLYREKRTEQARNEALKDRDGTVSWPRQGVTLGCEFRKKIVTLELVHNGKV